MDPAQSQSFWVLGAEGRATPSLAPGVFFPRIQRVSPKFLIMGARPYLKTGVVEIQCLPTSIDSAFAAGIPAGIPGISHTARGAGKAEIPLRSHFRPLSE